MDTSPQSMIANLLLDREPILSSSSRPFRYFINDFKFVESSIRRRTPPIFSQFYARLDEKLKPLIVC